LNSIFATLVAITALTATARGADSAAASPIDPKELSATVKMLASDAFEGRAPGSPGEAVTVDYLVERFRSLGLEPGGEAGGWVQKVPLIHDVSDTPKRLDVRVGGSTLSLVVGRDMSPQTTRATTRVKIANAPMVFVGYGVAAPERGWDDFKGLTCTARSRSFWSTIRISKQARTSTWRGSSEAGR